MHSSRVGSPSGQVSRHLALHLLPPRTKCGTMAQGLAEGPHRLTRNPNPDSDIGGPPVLGGDMGTTLSQDRSPNQPPATTAGALDATRTARPGDDHAIAERICHTMRTHATPKLR